jgi:hypothetical protein
LVATLHLFLPVDLPLRILAGFGGDHPFWLAATPGIVAIVCGTVFLSRPRAFLFAILSACRAAARRHGMLLSVLVIVGTTLSFTVAQWYRVFTQGEVLAYSHVAITPGAAAFFIFGVCVLASCVVEHFGGGRNRPLWARVAEHAYCAVLFNGIAVTVLVFGVAIYTVSVHVSAADASSPQKVTVNDE